MCLLLSYLVFRLLCTKHLMLFSSKGFEYFRGLFILHNLLSLQQIVVKNNMFVCDITGFNHNYALVTQHGVNQRRGKKGGWRVKKALVLILSHFVVFVSVFFNLTLTLSHSEKETEREDLTGMSWIPLETTRLCVALVSLRHGNLLGLLLLLDFIVVFLRSDYL